MAVVFSLLLLTIVTRLTLVQGAVFGSAIVLCLGVPLLARRLTKVTYSQCLAFAFFLAVPVTTLWGNLIPLALSDVLIIAGLIRPSFAESSERAGYPKAPYLALLLGSTVGILLTEFSSESATWIYLLQHRFEWLQTYLRTSPPLVVRALDQLHIFSVILGLISLLGKDEALRQNAIIGLTLGLLINGILSVIQYTYGFTEAYPNFHPFWNLEGRVAGLFTDPNSFGVSALLCFPLILISFKQSSHLSAWRLPLLIFLFLSALLSGSRTFLVGGFLTAAIYCALHFASGRNFSIQSLIKLTGILAIILLTFIGVILLAPHYAPQSIVRTLNTFLLPSWDGGFIGKFRLLQVALAMWFDFPVFGIGFGSFQLEFLSYVSKLALPFGAWQDNANNFYAQLAAEKGLWGLTLFFLTFLLFRRREELSQQAFMAQAGTIAFLFTLLLGPHLNFPEVSIIFALLISCGYELKPQPVSASLSFLLFIVTAISSFSTHYFADRGFYAWETAGPDQFFRWTKGAAVDWFLCPSSGVYHFEMNIAHPPDQHSYTAVSFSQGLRSETIVFSEQGSHGASVECKAGQKGSLSITSSERWIPLVADPKIQDVRPLGVMLKQERPTSFLEKQ